MTHDQKALQQDDFEQEFIKAVQKGNKIDAIKHYRNWKNVGFKEAAKIIQDGWGTFGEVYCTELVDNEKLFIGTFKGFGGITNTLKDAEANDMLHEKLVKTLKDREVQLKTLHRLELKIVVWYEHPPIPDRKFDYIAMYEHDDGDSGRMGNGSTPFMAIKDLIDNINPTEEFDSLRESRKRIHGK